MPILKNQRHELLVPGISRGLSGKQAYLKAYSNAGNSSAAEQSAARLLRSVKVRARIGELPERIAAKTVKLAVCERDNPLRWLEERLPRLIEARRKDRAEIPGGENGLLVRSYQQINSGKNARLMPEYGADAGMLREMRAHEERTERRDLSLKAMGSASDGEWAALLASIDG